MTTMTEPLTVTAGVTTGTFGIAIATIFPEATPAVMLCSLGGAALYVLSADEHEPWKQIIFAIISFIGGMYCAGTAADIITALINAALHKL
ncbi:putative holin, partial [Cronobacter dublinensis]|uniref:putative holin n=1 Tax=Cronobacter dublinensis TaxID=413497 RepID=UPI003AB9B617